jgi:hypothetical protein
VRVLALGAPWELRALLWVLLVSLGCWFWVLLESLGFGFWYIHIDLSKKNFKKNNNNFLIN